MMWVIIIAVILVIGGIFSIFCAYKDYDWFMENHKAWLIVKIFGRKGARIFYIGLGIFVIICALVMLFAFYRS